MQQNENKSKVATSAIGTLAGFLSIFIAGCFGFSVISTKRFFDEFNPLASRLLSFGDYGVFAVDAIAPLGQFIFWITLLIIVSLLLPSWFHETRINISTTVQEWWRRNKKLNLPSGISGTEDSYALFAPAHIDYTASANTKSEYSGAEEPDTNEKPSNNIDEVPKFKWVPNWDGFPTICVTMAVILSAHITLRDILVPSYLSVLWALFVCICFTIIMRAILHSIMTGDAVINDVRIRLKQNKVQNGETYTSLSDREHSFLDDRYRDLKIRRDAAKTLFLGPAVLCSVYFTANVHGQAKALSHYQQALYSTRMSPNLFNSESSTSINGKVVIRVIENGVLNFSDAELTELVFLNEEAKFQTRYDLKYFVAKSRLADITAEKLDSLREESSICLSDKFFIARLLSLRIFSDYRKDERCANLFDEHQKWLEEYTSRSH